ncbi:MAG: CapA family protein [Eubacteriales bacterium]|nr:CapA family protein [Eubacteriales bacterium]
MKKAAFILLCLFLLTGCGKREAPVTTAPPTTAVQETTVPATTEAETLPPATEAPEECFTLTFTGDSTLGCNPFHFYAGYGFVKTVGEDYRYPFANVIDYFENDECTFANLEGPLADGGSYVSKKHVFRGPTAFVNILTENSVDFVSLANNHAQDYGADGYQSTLDTLNAAGVPYVERDSSAVITTENGLKIGVYAMVYYLLDVEDMTAEIAALRQAGCDVVIVAPHWGVEMTYRPTDEQVAVAHAAIDAGADIVWGSHPHVLQPIEEYGGGVIFYSMGNFSFGGNIYPQDYDSALIQQQIIRGPEGVRLGERTVVPVSVSSMEGRNNYQPTPLAPGSEAYDRVLAKLNGTFDGPNLPPAY